MSRRSMSGAGPGAIAGAVARRSVSRGFLIGISNPKLILFAVAFLPQFINPAKAQVPQFAILVGSFAVIEAMWYGVYALGGRSCRATSAGRT